MVTIWLMMVNNNLVGVFSPTPLKNDGVKVSLDDDIPNMMGKHNPNVPNHQPNILIILLFPLLTID